LSIWTREVKNYFNSEGIKLLFKNHDFYAKATLLDVNSFVLVYQAKKACSLYFIQKLFIRIGLFLFLMVIDIKHKSVIKDKQLSNHLMFLQCRKYKIQNYAL